MHKLRIVRLIITWKTLLGKIVFYLEFSIVHRPLKIGISISEKYQKNDDFFFQTFYNKIKEGIIFMMREMFKME